MDRENAIQITDKSNGRGGGRGRNSWHGEGHQGHRSNRPGSSISSALREKREKAYDDFEYFWNKTSVFSQWYPSTFIIDGIDFTFTCAEQYMMFKKAELFSDTDAMEIILTLTDPEEMKDIGRILEVQDLSLKIWKERAIDIVREGNIAKFSQNEKLKEMLISTYPKELVQASPYDPIWGIGLAEDWEQALSKETWRGLNLLGYILTDIRNEIMIKDGVIDEHGVIPVDREALKARYVASFDNDDAEMDATSKEEQLDFLEGIVYAFDDNDGKETGIETKTAANHANEMDIGDKKALHKTDNHTQPEIIPPAVDGFMESLLPKAFKCFGAKAGDDNIETANKQIGKHNTNDQSTDLNYKMTRKPRGLCIIINNVDFPNTEWKTRVGSDKDKENLTQTFKWLGFVVTSYDNLKAADMIYKLVHVSHNTDHTNYDCFVCCILTHGELNHLVGSDGESIPITELTLNFEAHRCRSLVGKPKLFFLQACQGNKGMGEGMGKADNKPLDKMVKTLPNGADFLLGYSTVPGYLSFRYEETGSLYISSLCKQLRNYAHSLDILHILLRVNNEVSQEVVTYEGFTCRQIPAPQFTLRGDLYLKPI